MAAVLPMVRPSCDVDARADAARFAAMGVKQVRLHTGHFNDAARAAFAAEGFRVSVVEMLKGL